MVWLKDVEARAVTPGVAHLPNTDISTRPFVLSTAPLRKLEFDDHRFNPRTPSAAKVNELAASITYLGLLTPLTCCYLADEKKVVLIDGRHRYLALKALSPLHPDWAKLQEVDLKIYYTLETSDIFILSTYLNRTRRNLKKGEYFRVIVDIYENKQQELEGATGKKQTEEQIFEKISHRELTDRNYDLSIGRLVGLAAFDEEEATSWYPYIGNHQSATLPDNPGKEKGFCPMTAGNLGSFLKFLCKPAPYPDYGQRRAIELENVLELGRIFHKHLLEPVESHMTPTATTVGCKHWPLVAFGSILRDSSIFAGRAEGTAPLAEPLSKNQKDELTKVVKAYDDIMGEQAVLIQKYKESDDDQEILRKAWSYQTQKNLIVGYLQDELQDRVTGFKVEPKADEEQ